MKSVMSRVGLGILLLGMAALLGAPLLVSATSGACSYHGGVDCAAGPGIYGQVICNDGWPDSSVSYDSMVECEGYNTSPSCPANSYYDSLSRSCTCDAGYGVEGGACVNLDQQCMNQLGIMSDYNSLNNTCQCVAGYVISGGQCVSQDTYCRNTFGDYSESNYAGGCKCLYGAVPNSSQTACISGSSYCQDAFGQNATYDSISNRCGCLSGYQMTNGQCESVPVVSAQPAPVIEETYPSISSPPPTPTPVPTPAIVPHPAPIPVHNVPKRTSSSSPQTVSSSSSISNTTFSVMSSTASSSNAQGTSHALSGGWLSRVWKFLTGWF